MLDFSRGNVRTAIESSSLLDGREAEAHVLGVPERAPMNVRAFSRLPGRRRSRSR